MNAILSSQFPSRSLATTDGGYLSFGKASIPMIRTVIMATPFSGVSVVFRFGSYLKMGWIYAGRIIACMADNHAFRNWAYKKLVSIAVGADRLFAGQQENAVSVIIFCAHPKPAIARFVDALFKHILRAKNGVIAQLLLFMSLCVAIPAKPSSYCWRSTALNTFNFFFNLVRHGASPKSPLCAITME